MSNENEGFDGFGGTGFGLGYTGGKVGLSVGNPGDYSLGGALGGTPRDPGLSWGGEFGGNYDVGDFGLNKPAQPAFDPLSNPNVRFNLSSLFDDGNKLGLGLKNPGAFGPASLQNNTMQNLDTAVMSLPQIQGTPAAANTDDADKGVFGMFAPGTWGHKVGLRDPGSAAAKDFFGHETAQQRDMRMQAVSNGINDFGGAMLSAMTPTPVSMGLAAMKGYQDYQKTGDIQSALGTAFGAAPGYLGAAGQALKGNYGQAAARAAGLNGMDGLSSTAIGVGVDAARGRTPSRETLGGLAGYFGGSRLGGPVGGVIGRQFGSTLGGLFSGKK